MSERDDGGPAFQQVGHQPGFAGKPQLVVTGGMTLRDYFAAKAMQALLSHTPHVFEAATAWMVADAMLAERDK